MGTDLSAIDDTFELDVASGSNVARLPLADARANVADATQLTVLIEDRTFFRECVLASLRGMEPDQDFQAFHSVEAWAQSTLAARTSLLILWMSAPGGAEPHANEDRLQQVLALPHPPPVAVMSDHDGVEFVAQVMNSGATAFLPTTMGVELTVKVMAVVRAGATFVPATALAAMAGGTIASPIDDVPRKSELASILSPRQIAVARAMRKGQPNKVIACELAMSENTVKVHVRAIMRKLKARNRTEVAFLTRELDG